jgi:hypothetical protein
MSHPPSKQELEAVWNDSNVGWLKSYNKNARGKEVFTMEARPYIKHYLDPIEFTVFAKNYNKAMDEGRWRSSEAVREKYPYTEEQYKDISWEVKVKGRTTVK